MIRLSSTQFVYNYKKSLNTTYAKQGVLLEEADGSKLHRASDDAVGYAKLLRYNVSDTENDQYTSNVNTAISWMKMSDSALVNMTEIQKTFKEKVTAAANGTNQEGDLRAIGKEMMAEIQQIVSLGNTQQGDRYVFSGQSDLIQPFSLSTENNLVNRGLPKTLDDKQQAFFSDSTNDGTGSVSQMLALSGQDSTGHNVYYYLNTLTGDIYSQEFMDTGYLDKVAQGQTTVDPTADRVGTVDGFDPDGFVAKYFKNTGELKSAADLAADGVTPPTFTLTDGGTLSSDNYGFATVKQQIVTYSGDDKYISMVKLNGAIDPNADSVNLTGIDLFGSDIFDDANSGNEYSGSAMLNSMLTVYQMTMGNDQIWLGTDGMTLADSANEVTLTAETKMGARNQLYTSVTDMLTAQGENITRDITDVSAADVADLAVKLMEQQTIYNLALSLGARIIPQSLSDYL